MDAARDEQIRLQDAGVLAGKQRDMANQIAGMNSQGEPRDAGLRNAILIAIAVNMASAVAAK